MYGMVSYDILSSWVTNYFYPARARALFRSEMYRMLSWNCMVLPGISLYRLVYLLPLNGIAWYCIVLYCVVGFGARAVSRKTPIYFMFVYQVFFACQNHPAKTYFQISDVPISAKTKKLG